MSICSREIARVVCKSIPAVRGVLLEDDFIHLRSLAEVSEPPRAEVRAIPLTLEECAYRYGRCYDSYHVTDPGREQFFTRNGRGSLAFARTGKTIHITGGLLAPDDEKETLLTEFIAHARRQKSTFAFYNISDDDLPLFRKHGFVATKWGEDAIVDLDGCSWTGKAYEFARSQANYCRRNGIVCFECRRESMSPAAWAALMHECEDISTALLATKPQACEMKFFEGCFDPACLGRKRIFIARAAGGAGRIESFLICNPGLEGKMWSIDIYRRRPDAIKGTITFLIMEAMQLLHAEGVNIASLGLVPGMRCDQPLAGDSRLIRIALVVFHRYLNFLFDTPGLYHFKQRFRPRFENRYICVWPRPNLAAAWSFMQLCGVLNLNAGRVIDTVISRLRKRDARAQSLTSPADGRSPSLWHLPVRSGEVTTS